MAKKNGASGGGFVAKENVWLSVVEGSGEERDRNDRKTGEGEGEAAYPPRQGDPTNYRYWGQVLTAWIQGRDGQMAKATDLDAFYTQTGAPKGHLAEIIHSSPSLEKSGWAAKLVVRFRQQKTFRDWGPELEEWVSQREGKFVRGINLDHFYREKGAPRKVLQQILEYAPTLEQVGTGPEKLVRVIGSNGGEQYLNGQYQQECHNKKSAAQASWNAAHGAHAAADGAGGDGSVNKERKSADDFLHWGRVLTRWIRLRERQYVRGVNLDHFYRETGAPKGMVKSMLAMAPDVEKVGQGADMVLRIRMDARERDEGGTEGGREQEEILTQTPTSASASMDAAAANTANKESMEKETMERKLQTTQAGISYATMAATTALTTAAAPQVNAVAAAGMASATDYRHWGNELTKWVSEKESKSIRGVNLDFFYKATGAPKKVLNLILEHAPRLEQKGVGADKIIRVKEAEANNDFRKWGVILTEWVKGQDEQQVKSVDLNYFYEDTGAPRKVLNQILEFAPDLEKVGEHPRTTIKLKTKGFQYWGQELTKFIRNCENQECKGVDLSQFYIPTGAPRKVLGQILEYAPEIEKAGDPGNMFLRLRTSAKVDSGASGAGGGAGVGASVVPQAAAARPGSAAVNTQKKNVLTPEQQIAEQQKLMEMQLKQQQMEQKLQMEKIREQQQQIVAQQEQMRIQQQQQRDLQNRMQLGMQMQQGGYQHHDIRSQQQYHQQQHHQHPGGNNNGNGNGNGIGNGNLGGPRFGSGNGNTTIANGLNSGAQNHGNHGDHGHHYHNNSNNNNDNNNKGTNSSPLSMASILNNLPGLGDDDHLDLPELPNSIDSFDLAMRPPQSSSFMGGGRGDIFGSSNLTGASGGLHLPLPPPSMLGGSPSDALGDSTFLNRIFQDSNSNGNNNSNRNDGLNSGGGDKKKYGGSVDLDIFMDCIVTECYNGKALANKVEARFSAAIHCQGGGNLFGSGIFNGDEKKRRLLTTRDEAAKMSLISINEDSNSNSSNNYYVLVKYDMDKFLGIMHKCSNDDGMALASQVSDPFFANIGVSGEEGKQRLRFIKNLCAQKKYIIVKFLQGKGSLQFYKLERSMLPYDIKASLGII